MDNLCYLCFVFVILSCLFITALWSPAEKGLTSWFSYVFCQIPMWCSGSGVVFDCIDSSSLSSSLLSLDQHRD